MLTDCLRTVLLLQILPGQLNNAVDFKVSGQLTQLVSQGLVLRVSFGQLLGPGFDPGHAAKFGQLIQGFDTLHF